MRRTVLLCRLGLAGAASLAVLTACGGSGGSTTAASTSAARTASTPTTTAAAAGGSFCEQARDFGSKVASSVQALTSPNGNSGQALQQVVTQLQSIQPPPAIADDWKTALADLQQLASALASGVPSDQAGAGALATKLAPLQQQLTTAGNHIDQYLQTKCGISAGDTASPTS